jgi:phosphotransferase system HPr (HPr) family protein
MTEMWATVRNAQGIHCRPSAVILRAVQPYPGEITVSAPAGEARLVSVMQLLGLGLHQGSRVAIRVSGPDEQVVCSELVRLFETHFDFPPQTDDSGPEASPGEDYYVYRPAAPRP